MNHEKSDDSETDPQLHALFCRNKAPGTPPPVRQQRQQIEDADSAVVVEATACGLDRPGTEPLKGLRKQPALDRFPPTFRAALTVGRIRPRTSSGDGVSARRSRYPAFFPVA